MADALISSGMCDKFYKNKDKMTVFDLVSKYNIKSVQKYLVNQQAMDKKLAEKKKDPGQTMEEPPKEEQNAKLSPSNRES